MFFTYSDPNSLYFTYLDPVQIGIFSFFFFLPIRISFYLFGPGFFLFTFSDRLLFFTFSDQVFFFLPFRIRFFSFFSFYLSGSAFYLFTFSDHQNDR